MAASNPPAPSAAAIAAGLSGVTMPTALLQGELVKYDLLQGSYEPYTVGSSTISEILQGISENHDSSLHMHILTVPPGTTQGAAIRCILYGSVIGVRWQRDANAPPFYVTIDGVAYSVLNTAYSWNGQPSASSTTTDGDSFRIIASGLQDGPHSVEIGVAADPLGVTTYTLNLYGVIVERRVGYSERTKLQGVITRATGLGTSASSISNGSSSAPNIFPGLRAVQYVNTSASAVTVSVQYGSIIVWQASLAAAGTAGCSATFDLLDATAFSGTSSATFGHYASAAGAVNYMILGKN